MEIGSNQPEASHQDLSSADGFLHLRYDGCSLLIFDSTKHRILHLVHTSWLATRKANEIAQRLESFIREEAWALDELVSLRISLSFAKFTLLPDTLYQQGMGHSLLSKTCNVDASEQVFSDFLNHRDVALIYAADESLISFCNSLNLNTEIAHNAYALNLLARINPSGGDFFMMDISDSFAELLFIKDKALIFYNQYPHDVKEDLLYYLLFVLEQNRILATEVKLYLSGTLDGGLHDIAQLFKTYIGEVEDLPTAHLSRQNFSYSQSQLRAAANLLALL